MIVDDVPLDRAGSLVRVRVDAMDDRGILHAHMLRCDGLRSHDGDLQNDYVPNLKRGAVR